MDGYKLCSNKECNKILPLSCFKKAKFPNGYFYLKKCKDCVKRQEAKNKREKYKIPELRKKNVRI